MSEYFVNPYSHLTPLNKVDLDDPFEKVVPETTSPFSKRMQNLMKTSKKSKKSLIHVNDPSHGRPETTINTFRSNAENGPVAEEFNEMLQETASQDITDGSTFFGRQLSAAGDYLGDLTTEEWMKGIGLTAAAAGTLIGGIMEKKAVEEQGKQQAMNLREQGQFALEKATREAKSVDIKHRFQEAEDIEGLKQTHLFSGQQSFAAGTGTDSLLSANKNAARQLMNDIIAEGQKQKAFYDRAAKAAEEAAKKRGKGKVFGAIGSVAGAVGGFYAGGFQGASIGMKAGGQIGQSIGGS